MKAGQFSSQPHLYVRVSELPICYFRFVKTTFSILMAGLLVASCGNKEESILPRTGPIVEAVYSSGIIKAAQQYNVVSQVNGVLHEVLVSAGDTVAKNQPLFVLRDIQAQLNNQNALILLQLSKAQASPRSERIAELEEQVRLAKVAFELDSTLFEKQSRLWDQGIGSQLELEQRQLAMTSSRANLTNARSRLGDVRRQLESAYQQAEVNYRKSQEALREYIVRSAIDGLVYDISREPGELITTQTPLAVIGSHSQFIIELQVDENDIARVREKQAVRVTLESYPGEVFPAKVTRINPIMNSRTRTFVVEARFEVAPPRLYPFLTVEANIISKEKKNALIIPINYLYNDIYIITSSFDTLEVKTGLRDLEKTEIISGIDSTTRLIKPVAR